VRVLALDPGGTTGLAQGWWHADGALDFTSWELETLEALAAVEQFASAPRGSPRAVVCESWTPRPGIRTFQPEALESIGAARYLCWQYHVPFTLQSPADAKRFATNAKLKILGWRNPSPGGHADDAARHLMVYAVQHGLVDPAVFLPAGLDQVD